MRPRRALSCALAAAGLAASAAAQPADAPGTLPSGPATLRGRIVHETSGEVAGLPVVLYASGPDGAAVLGHANSDESGAFAFEGLSNDPGTVYLVGVRAGELPFATRATFERGETLREVELRIRRPSSDASRVQHRRARLRLGGGCGGLRVLETHELHNPGDEVIFVPAAERARAKPLLALELPSGAGRVSVPLGSLGLEQESERVAFFGPLHPGTHELEYFYPLPLDGEAASVRWRFERGVERVELLAPEAGPHASGAGIAAGGTQRLDGRSYSTGRAGPLAPGAELAVRLEMASAAEAALVLHEAQSWLELDDAALDVDATFRLEVPGEAALAAADSPRLCLPLLPGAEGLRFSTELLGMGVEPDPSGALALYGPIPSGESQIALRYRLPVRDPTVAVSQRFDRPVERLGVMVADTGVVVETTRLHRRRSVQDGGRSYLQFEGFAIEPGEAVSLRLARLEPPWRMPRAATLALALALAAGSIAALATPLRGRSEEARLDGEAARIETEREALREALRSLEEDFETGKLDAADHAELRGELRARLAEMLQEDGRRGVETGPSHCPGCGTPLAPEARFCHRCGARVDAAARAPQ